MEDGGVGRTCQRCISDWYLTNQIYIINVVLSDRYEGYSKRYSCLYKLWSHACM